MTSMGLRRISALVIVLAIALAGLEWCLSHQHPAETGTAISAPDCPSDDSLHLAEQSARQPSVSVSAPETTPPPAMNRAEPAAVAAAATIPVTEPRCRSGAARLIDLCVSRT